MRRFVIERDIRGAGKLSPRMLRAIAKTWNAVAREMGGGIQWEHSYVTGNRIYCVYVAENDEMIREHGRLGNSPCTKVSEVVQVIGPVTEFGATQA